MACKGAVDGASENASEAECTDGSFGGVLCGNTWIEYNGGERWLIPRVQEIDKQIRLIMEGENKGYEDVAHRTVFHEILSSKILRPDEKTPEVLYVVFCPLHLIDQNLTSCRSDEAQSIVLAGIETTKAIMVTACFWVLEKPEVNEQLRKELEAAIPDPSNMPSLSSLQNIPYLSAVVQEGTKYINMLYSTHR